MLLGQLIIALQVDFRRWEYQLFILDLLYIIYIFKFQSADEVIFQIIMSEM